jgi:hypothetical protein
LDRCGALCDHDTEECFINTRSPCGEIDDFLLCGIEGRKEGNRTEERGTSLLRAKRKGQKIENEREIETDAFAQVNGTVVKIFHIPLDAKASMQPHKYAHREREKEREAYIHTHTPVHTSIYTHRHTHYSMEKTLYSPSLPAH